MTFQGEASSHHKVDVCFSLSNDPESLSFKHQERSIVFLGDSDQIKCGVQTKIWRCQKNTL